MRTHVAKKALGAAGERGPAWWTSARPSAEVCLPHHAPTSSIGSGGLPDEHGWVPLASLPSLSSSEKNWTKWPACSPNIIMGPGTPPLDFPAGRMGAILTDCCYAKVENRATTADSRRTQIAETPSRPAALDCQEYSEPSTRVPIDMGSLA